MTSPTPPRRITLDQVVAYNLRRARQLRSWTQGYAAERLEPYLGERWSSAVFSAAERSFEGTRVREFTASHVLAFSLGFELPIAWFYVPPSPDAQITARGSDETISGEDLIWLLFPAPREEDSRGVSLGDRLSELGLDPTQVQLYPGSSALTKLVAEQVKTQLEANAALRALLKAPEDSEERARAGARLADVFKRGKESDDGEGTDPQDPS